MGRGREVGRGNKLHEKASVKDELVVGCNGSLRLRRPRLGGWVL